MPPIRVNDKICYDVARRVTLAFSGLRHSRDQRKVNSASSECSGRHDALKPPGRRDTP